MYKFSLAKNSAVFMAISLAIFIFLAGVYFYFFSWLYPVDTEKSAVPDSGAYYLKEEQKPDDPLVTKIPDLKDILAGPIISGLDPSLGPTEAKITVVIFSDYTCSYCLKTEKAIMSVLEEFPSEVRFIRKDYPENDKGSLSWLAAVAARCAGEQGDYWPYHDLSVAESDNLSISKLDERASNIGLDMNRFSACRSSVQSEKTILDNMAEADALGITGVPFVYINDQSLLGEIEANELREVIKMKLVK